MQIHKVIRQAIVESGQSATKFGAGLGICQSSMSRFISGKQGMSISTLQRVCDALNLELRPRQQPCNTDAAQ